MAQAIFAICPTTLATETVQLPLMVDAAMVKLLLPAHMEIALQDQEISTAVLKKQSIDQQDHSALPLTEMDRDLLTHTIHAQVARTLEEVMCTALLFRLPLNTVGALLSVMYPLHSETAQLMVALAPPMVKDQAMETVMVPQVLVALDLNLTEEETLDLLMDKDLFLVVQANSVAQDPTVVAQFQAVVEADTVLNLFSNFNLHPNILVMADLVLFNPVHSEAAHNLLKL